MQLRIEAKAADVVLRVLRPDGLQHTHRHEVFRFSECRAQPHRSFEFSVVVLRLPVLAAGLRGRHKERRVVDDRRRREPFLERRRVNEGLERRSRLPQRLRRMVELVAVVIEAADERIDGAVARRHRDKRGLGLRQRRDRVAPLFVTNDTNYGTPPNPLRGRRLVG